MRPNGPSGCRWRLTLSWHSVICASHAGIAQLVERNLAKVEVASSSLVSRSSLFVTRWSPWPSWRRSGQYARCRRIRKPRPAPGFLFFDGVANAVPPAWWQSGHAAACKAVYAGSIPTQASILPAATCSAGRMPPHQAFFARARMAKLVYARDLKSLGRKAMRVRLPLRAPKPTQLFVWPMLEGRTARSLPIPMYEEHFR